MCGFESARLGLRKSGWVSRSRSWYGYEDENKNKTIENGIGTELELLEGVKWMKEADELGRSRIQELR